MLHDTYVYTCIYPIISPTHWTQQARNVGDTFYIILHHVYIYIHIYCTTTPPLLVQENSLQLRGSSAAAMQWLGLRRGSLMNHHKKKRYNPPSISHKWRFRGIRDTKHVSELKLSKWLFWVILVRRNYIKPYAPTNNGVISGYINWLVRFHPWSIGLGKSWRDGLCFL